MYSNVHVKMIIRCTHIIITQYIVQGAFEKGEDTKLSTHSDHPNTTIKCTYVQVLLNTRSYPTKRDVCTCAMCRPAINGYSIIEAGCLILQ